VSLKAGKALQEEEFILWLRDQMAHYKVPKSIVIIDELPKTAANKPDKESLMEEYGGIETD
jgi:fatty-acyl-CoA synthase